MERMWDLKVYKGMNSAHEHMLLSSRETHTTKTTQLTTGYFRLNKDSLDTFNALCADRSWTWHKDKGGPLVGYKYFVKEPEASHEAKNPSFIPQGSAKDLDNGPSGSVAGSEVSALPIFSNGGIFMSRLEKHQLIETDRIRNPKESLIERKC